MPYVVSIVVAGKPSSDASYDCVGDFSVFLVNFCLTQAKH